MGALEREGKRLIAVVLACGWPNNRTWKWSDTKKLMSYGIENFHKKTVGEEKLELEPVRILDGQTASVRASADVRTEQVLLKEGDTFQMDVLKPDALPAPVQKGELVGTVIYYLNGEIFDLFPIYIEDDSLMIDYEWCLEQIVCRWIPDGPGL